MKRYYSTAVITGIILTTPPAFANSDMDPGIKEFSLGEVVVTAKMPGDEVVTQVEVTAEEIELQNAKTLDQALSLAPGVAISVGGKGIPRINVRGLRNRHTLLLLDGVPINSTYDGQFDPRLVPTENIARIKVEYGTSSVLYGQGALAGVINIITKQGTEGLHMGVTGDIDDHGNYYSKLQVYGGGEKLNYFISGSSEDSDGFQLSDNFDATKIENGDERENSDDKRLSLFGNIGYDISDVAELALTMGISSYEYGVPPMVYNKTIDPVFGKQTKYERVEDSNTFTNQLSFGYEPAGIFSMRTWAFYNSNEEDVARYDNDTYTTTINKKGSYELTNKTDIWGGTVQTAFDFDTSGTTTFSFSAQRDEYASMGHRVTSSGSGSGGGSGSGSGNGNGNSKDGQSDVTVNTIDYDEHIDTYNLALEHKIQLLDTLELVAGYGHHFQNRESNDDDMSSYMLALSYDLTQTTTLRTSYAHKVRFPSISQLYDVSHGNENLDPEEADNFEVGINQTFLEDLNLDLTLFYNDVENYIEKDDATDVFQNNDEYVFKGLQLSLSKPFMETGFARISYTYMDSENKSSEYTFEELHYRPEHKVTLDTNYSWNFGLTAHANIKYVGTQYYYNSTETRQGKLDDYTLVNCRLEQKVYKDTLSLYVGVNNLFDVDYESSYGYPQAGQTFYFGFKGKM